MDVLNLSLLIFHKRHLQALPLHVDVVSDDMILVLHQPKMTYVLHIGYSCIYTKYHHQLHHDNILGVHGCHIYQYVTHHTNIFQELYKSLPIPWGKEKTVVRGRNPDGKSRGRI